MIEPFSKREADNLSSYKGFVNGTDMTFGEFIDYSLANKEKSHRFYFGKMSNELADRIENEIGCSVKNYALVIDSDEVRHIFLKHGNSVTKDILKKLSEVFDSPDEIRKSPFLDSGMRIAFFVRKKINGYGVIINGVSDGKHAIRVDSFFITKNDVHLKQIIESTKKRRFATSNTNGPELTSETRGKLGSFNDNIQ